MHRLFFALWPDAATRDALAAAAADLRRSRPGRVRMVRPERLHLTLRFIGDVAERSPGDVDTLRAAASAVRTAPLRLVIDRAGHFQRGRVWWLGSSTEVAGLAGLHEALAPAGAIAGAGRGFLPHITIGRDAGVPLDAAIEPIVWSAHDFVLVDSTPADGYRVIGRWPLSA